MCRVFGVILLIGSAVGTALLLVARFVSPFRPEVTHQMVMLPRQHRHLDGLRIAFVSDTHVGPSFTAKDLTPIINALRREKPDILLLGGDYISQSPFFIDDAAPAIADMVSTARFGAYGVLGNHDVSNVRTRVTNPLRAVGVTILENDSVVVETDRGKIWIAGVDDLLMGLPDLAKTFFDVPADAACICLWHEPDLAEQAEAYGPFLQLSGHTHGGQVRMPFLGPLALPKMGKRFPSGRYEIGDMTLLVSNGVGLYRPPIRFSCPPQLAIIRLIA